MAAMAYFAVARTDPARLTTFMKAAYRRIHEGRARLGDPATWSAAAKEASVSDFEKGWTSVQKGQLEDALRKLLAYGVDATPSVAIGGRYVVTPDSANGDLNLFFQLCSGMVSKAMGYAG